MYVNTNAKFSFVLAIAVLWAAFSVWISFPWASDLSSIVGGFFAHTIIWGIAIIPGFQNAFIAGSLLVDKRPPRRLKPLDEYPDITVLIAAYNEEDCIGETLDNLSRQLYPKTFTIIVSDDGSTDRTPEIVKTFPNVKLIRNKKNKGKSYALNAGLLHVKTPYLVTVDADSILYKDALLRIVERIISDPPRTAAVAGAVLARNSRENLVTRMQEWDYFLGIAAVKRMQSLYQGTKVAQGAFSIYKTDIVEQAGGWKDTVGEDIVLTWGLLEKGYRIGFAEDACLFTNVPTTMKQFIRQRQRWSRGLIEAFKHHWRILFKARKTTLIAWWNLLFPLTDTAFTLAFLPGIVLALAGIYWIAGPMTLILFPMLAVVNYLIYKVQKPMFDSQGLRIRRNYKGLFFYTVCYAMILQPACVLGYIQEIIRGSKKSWGTK